QLAVLGEVVGRYPRDAHRMPAASEIEESLVGPDFGAVVRDVEGHVADQADAQLPAAAAERLPLAVELELHEFVEADLRGEFPPRLGQRPAVVRAGPPVPFGPDAAAVGVL